MQQQAEDLRAEGADFYAFLGSLSDSDWDMLVLTGADFEYIGRAIEDIFIDAEARELTGSFEFRVIIQRKFRNGDWQPVPASISSADEVLDKQTADGCFSSSSAFSTRTKFGYRTRLVLQYRANQTGGGAVGDSAELSISAAVRFFAS